MNILLFVTAFIIILSTLTYAKIDNFRTFAATEAQFEMYIEKIENAYGNMVAKRWYDTTIAKRTATANSRQAAAASSPRLAIKILFDPKMQQKDPGAYQQTLTWLKQLMIKLYGAYPFLKEALEKRPSILDELVDRIKRTVEELPEADRPKEASDLANLNLGEELQTVFYLMLKGCPIDNKEISNTTKRKISYTPPQKHPNPEENDDDENDVAEAANEYKSEDGYDSLLNYITMKNTTKIRVFLAPREVLAVVFGSDTAETILATRHQLYLAVVRGDLPADQATQQFKSQFESYMRGSNPLMLDFKVSKTDPQNYN